VASETRAFLRRSRARRSAGAVLLAAAAAAAPAGGQVVSDLEPERPIAVEDARPIAYRALAVSADWSYNARGSADDTGPGFSALYGATRGLELGAALRYVTRPGRNALRGISSGDLEVHALYGVVNESARGPGVAVRLGVHLPTGLDSRGTDVHFAALATRSFDSFRLHGNARWTRIGDTLTPERADRLEGTLGVDFLPSRRGSTDTLLMASVQVRSSPILGGEMILEAEVGGRRRIGAQSVFFAGAGSQLSGEGDRAKVRIRAGVGHLF